MAEIRKLGRKTDHRLAMLKNLTTSVIWHGQIETTEAKAKEVKSIVDSLISLAIKENMIEVQRNSGGSTIMQEFENTMLERSGLLPVTLGARVLRSEYAVTALLAKLS